MLAYHNIVPDEMPPEGDRSLHLGRSDFARQLDSLVRTCDVVPLATVLSEPPPHARARVAITFDDAYHGALTLGAAELRARSLPATMFVAPGLLGGRTFWWDALASRDGLRDAVRDEALTRYGGADDVIREWAQRDGMPVSEVSSWQRSGTEAEVFEWAATDLLTVGAHTWSHANLTRLANGEAAQEVARPLAWLRSRLPNRTVPWLTYPYGLVTPAVQAITMAAGYVAAMKVAGGWIPRSRDDAFTLPRLNVPRGLTLRGYRLRLAGVMGSAVAPMQHPGSRIWLV